MSTLLRVLRIVLILLAVLAATVWLVFRLPAFGGMFDGPRLERMRQSPEYHGDHFENTPPYVSNLGLLRTVRDYLQDQVREPRFQIPVLPLDPARLRTPPAPGMRAWWFGHASVLVEIDGLRIMTDPVLSERASPLQSVGPRRFHAPPLPLAQLEGVDAVLISHDHYDHLDMATVQQLARGGSHFYVGLGIGAHLERWAVPAVQIHEMDWWESRSLKGVAIHMTPARHYSGRKRMDDSTLWSSWMVRGPARSFYFSGDSGYAPHFAEIRRRLGAPELTLIKVGAYGDTWLDIHMDPESAVRAHRDLGGTLLLPVHWATFNLAYHDWDEPILRSVAAAQAAGVSLVTPRIGEPVEWGQTFTSQPWYAAQRQRPAPR